MQIFHWLFKVTRDKEREDSSVTSSNHNSKDQIATGKDIIIYKQNKRSNHIRSEREKQKKFGIKSYIPFSYLCRKDVSAACFYSTIHLKRIDNYNNRKRKYWVSTMKIKEEITQGDQMMISSNKMDSSANTNVGNRVLPITDATLSSTSKNDDQCNNVDQKLRGDKIKAISRMKELIKWAAAAKSEKRGKFLGRKVLHFRNKASLKAVPDDEQMSNESPKISFRWEVESCSTITSSCSGKSVASSRTDLSLNMLSLNCTSLHDRKGNWITTDSEFVVLEL